MSWKSNTVFIQPAHLGGGAVRLLTELDIDGRSDTEQTRYPGRGGSIWLAEIGAQVVIETPCVSYFEPVPDEQLLHFQAALVRNFPTATITAIILNGQVGAWGIAVFKSGELIRKFMGCDGIVFFVEGSPLPIERELDGQFTEEDREHFAQDYRGMQLSDGTKAS